MAETDRNGGTGGISGGRGGTAEEEALGAPSDALCTSPIQPWHTHYDMCRDAET